MHDAPFVFSASAQVRAYLLTLPASGQAMEMRSCAGERPAEVKTVKEMRLRAAAAAAARKRSTKAQQRPVRERHHRQPAAVQAVGQRKGKLSPTGVRRC